VPAILLRYLGAGFKLMNPVDLGEAFGRAVESPAAPGQRFVIGCYTPYGAAEAGELQSLSRAVVERHYPGVPELVEELGLSVPEVPYYFNHEKARTQLGFPQPARLGEGGSPLPGVEGQPVTRVAIMSVAEGWRQAFAEAMKGSRAARGSSTPGPAC